jgi:NAD(P)-dependent dehydrogenase (short-subunit alcohol dehydrogenase family)
MASTEQSADPTGVRVVITGATSGLGLAMAEALVDGGARVAVTGRDHGRVHAAVSRLRRRVVDGGPGGPSAGADVATTVVGAVVDVRDAASVHAGLGEAAGALGGIDVVVNNAGLGMRSVNPAFLADPGKFWEVTPEGFRAVVDTNLTGYFLVARAAVPHLADPGPQRPFNGRIINITMNHQTMCRKGFVPYGPSRAGAEALSHIMAADLAELGISVNLLLPGGATLTGMIPDDLDEAARATLLPASVVGRPVRWLASPAAEDVNDERIVATEFEAWLAAR